MDVAALNKKMRPDRRLYARVLGLHDSAVAGNSAGPDIAFVAACALGRPGTGGVTPERAIVGSSSSLHGDPPRAGHSSCAFYVAPYHVGRGDAGPSGSVGERPAPARRPSILVPPSRHRSAGRRPTRLCGRGTRRRRRSGEARGTDRGACDPPARAAGRAAGRGDRGDRGAGNRRTRPRRSRR
jgi:hypothetical protein